MAYLYQLALRISDNIVAPIKVAICKSKEVILNQSQLFLEESTSNKSFKKIKNNNENCDNDDNEVEINVDGLDPQSLIKKMERLNPQTDLITSYSYFFSLPTMVHEKLYLGSAYNAACWYTLESLEIKYIINVTAEIDNFHETNGITYHKIPIKDDNNETIIPYLEEAFQKLEEFLLKKDGNVMVHCYMGASRSASVVAYYIAKKTNTDVADVITNLIEKRPVVNPTQKLVADLISGEI